MQGNPAQQSAFAVQACPAAWQLEALQTSAPLAFGTHGLPLQHSLAMAHAPPELMHPAPASPTPVYALQRGTPKGSSTQARNLGCCVPQQSDRALEMLQV
jgi:hypothetical protein